jgi:hypothetical protein
MVVFDSNQMIYEYNTMAMNTNIKSVSVIGDMIFMLIKNKIIWVILFYYYSRVPEGAGNSLHDHIQTGYGAHPAS